MSLLLQLCRELTILVIKYRRQDESQRRSLSVQNMSDFSLQFVQACNIIMARHRSIKAGRTGWPSHAPLCRRDLNASPTQQI